MLSDRREKGQPTIDLSKLGKAIGKSSASKTGKKRHKKLLGAEVMFLFCTFCNVLPPFWLIYLGNKIELAHVCSFVYIESVVSLSML